ncbi:hypothetical protein U9M48_030549 [Paspalum notatum var. saurae]|uniref:Uncharacterized protein n=1 Tax=Paspalum notatum var. saurae TaxID=547442 RepID=A0AAQ3X3D3_PASNO
MNQQKLTLVIKVQSFWSLPDRGPKTYSRSQTLTTVVEMNGYGLLQLVDYIEWFQLNQEKGVVHIDAQINDFEGPLQFSPTKRRFHPSVRNNVEPTPESTNDDEEPIGVDEEETYSDTESLVAPGDSSYDSQFAVSSDSDGSDLEYEPDEEIIDEDDEDALSVFSYEDALSVFSYDVDDPCVDIGVVFRDLKQCKSA